jgi:hypothetical protein
MDIIKEYLGDGLWAEIRDGYMIVLKANSETDPTDTVFLEPEVLERFYKFVEKYRCK